MNEYYNDFLKLGYSEAEAEELAMLAEKSLTDLPEISYEEQMKIVDALNAIGCTSFLMTADEIRQILSTQNTDGTDSIQEVEIS